MNIKVVQKTTVP